MPEQPEPDDLSSAPASPVEPLQITTPVIDIQDLEHQCESGDSRVEQGRADRAQDRTQN
jgi:hypothetical protein